MKKETDVGRSRSWSGVGVDFSKPESESESVSLKFGRLRSPANDNVSAFLLAIPNLDNSDGG